MFYKHIKVVINWIYLSQFKYKTLNLSYIIFSFSKYYFIRFQINQTLKLVFSFCIVIFSIEDLGLSKLIFLNISV